MSKETLDEAFYGPAFMQAPPERNARVSTPLEEAGIAQAVLGSTDSSPIILNPKDETYLATFGPASYKLNIG